MRLEINETELNVFEAGEKNYSASYNANFKMSRPSLVFLHYFGGSSRSWTEVIEKLESDFHCVAPDLRGFGESNKKNESYSLEDSANDIAELISTLRLGAFALVGHSMGGKVAFALAARKPKGLQSLILLAPSPPSPEPMAEAERRRLLETHGDKSAAIETIGKIVAHDLPPVVFERTVNDNLRSNNAAWRAWLETESRKDVSAEVGKIDVPVLVAAGERDEAMTAELLTGEIVQRINGARLVVVPAVKHLLPLEAPAAVAGLIREHCRIVF